MKQFISVVGASALIVVAPALAGAVPSSSVSSRTAVVSYAAQAAQAGDLAARVKSQIDANQEFAGSDVTVTAEGGVVTLRGVAPSAVVRLKIVEMTQKTEGVTKVVNKVTIAKTKK